MEKFLYLEVSSSDYMMLPVKSIMAIDGASATSIEIFYQTLLADPTDETANDEQAKAVITVTSGEAKAFLEELAKAINLTPKNHIGFIDVEALPISATVASIGISGDA